MSDFINMFESTLSVELAKYCAREALQSLVDSAKTSLKRWLNTNQCPDNQSQDKVMDEIKSSIELHMKSGAKVSINGDIINRITLDALNIINLNHGDGDIKLTSTNINADKICTGGTGNGSTVIKNSELRSSGTLIILEEGCSIIMEGDAQMEQS